MAIDNGMKTLIAYYSYTGSNEDLARRLGKKISADLLKIEELRRRTPFRILFDLLFDRKPAIRTEPCALKVYDHVIFIAPIWAGRIASPLISFIAGEKENLRRYSFLTFCGGVEGQKVKLERQLGRVTGKSPAYVSELWLKNLPLTDEKRKALEWNKGYIMSDEDFRFFESKVDTFLSLSGVSLNKDINREHEHVH